VALLPLALVGCAVALIAAVGNADMPVCGFVAAGGAVAFSPRTGLIVLAASVAVFVVLAIPAGDLSPKFAIVFTVCGLATSAAGRPGRSSPSAC
jgi:hypothetical protein